MRKKKESEQRNDSSNQALNDVLNLSHGNKSAKVLVKRDGKKKKSAGRLDQSGSNLNSLRRRRLSPWRKESPERSSRQRSESPMLQSNEILYNPNLKFIVDLISKKVD